MDNAHPYKTKTGKANNVYFCSTYWWFLISVSSGLPSPLDSNIEIRPINNPTMAS